LLHIISKWVSKLRWNSAAARVLAAARRRSGQHSTTSEALYVICARAPSRRSRECLDRTNELQRGAVEPPFPCASSARGGTATDATLLHGSQRSRKTAASAVATRAVAICR